jgi:hypothetical protein
MALEIGRETLVLRAIQMNAERWNAKNRPLDVHQTRRRGRVGRTDNHATSNRQITIKPRVPQSTAIGLHSDLRVSVRRRGRHRLEHKVGRIGVRADQRESVARLKFPAHRKRRNRRLIARVKVLAATRQRPVRVLLQLGEAARHQIRFDRVNTVKVRR